MMAQEQVRTDFFAFGGGLNMVQPALSVQQGMLLDVQNYEPSMAGGYARTGGYERFDGRAAPSGAVYAGVACTLTSTPAVGATVVCGAFTGLFVSLVAGGMLLTAMTGIFPGNAAMTVGGLQVGTTLAASPLSFSSDPKTDAQISLSAGNVLRNLITAVPGSGAVRGVWMIGSTLYAWRDNAGGTACAIWASSAAGWTAVPMYSDIKFSAGQAALATLAEGVTLYGATSGATATLKRIVRESGVHTSNNSVGRFIIAPLTGNFNNAEAIKITSVAGATVATSASTAGVITIAPGGRYQFCSYNFTGKTGTVRSYGVSGVDRAFEFDGLVYVPINSGATVDTPSYIAAVNNYLYLGIRSSMINSSLVNPYGYQVTEGSAELSLGDDLTGLQQMRGSAMAMLTRNTTQQLVGASSSSWVKSFVSSDTGSVPYTVQTVGDTFALDDRGVTQMSATQNYGNFSMSTVSRLVQPMIDAARGKVIASCVLRQRDQYRLFLNDGSVLVMYQDSMSATPVKAFTRLQYLFTPSAVTSQEDSGGVERLFIGGTNGMVYEVNKGSSFDGAAIEAYCRIWYINNQSPRLRKRYRKAVLEMTSLGYSPLSGSGEFSYGDTSVNTTQDSIEAQGGGGLWDTANWDQFYYDAQTITQPALRIDGTGVNVALLFYSNTALDAGHTLQGAIIHYSPRRMER